ncbi:MAG: hypothetical protein HY301_17245 [Verrucomicrobia bacterium]|nr:hypothetical protein [Verrucomicrobiota bacterium]
MKLFHREKDLRRARQRGSAVFVVLALVVLLSAFVGANLLALRGLEQEIKLVEKKQRQRWEATAGGGSRTNAPAAENSKPRP